VQRKGKLETGKAAPQRRSRTRAAQAGPESRRSSDCAQARRQAPAEVPPLPDAGQWAGFLAHELRQPLSVIGNVVAGLLASPAADRAVTRNLRLIQQQTELAGRTLANLVQYARAGRPRRAALDLGAATARCVAGVRKPRSIRCRLSVPRPLAPALADAGHVECILSNLIRNAVESIRGPGVVSLTVRAGGRQLRVQVADTGCGVPSGLREKIFEQDFTTKSGGTGLGLALCRQLAEANGGTVRLQRRRGQGSTFELRLPMACEPV